LTVHVLLTADNHLDITAVQYGPRRFERKRDFQRCFEALVGFALENRPDLVLVGGDFYDTILPGNPTRAFVSEQFKQLHDKDIKIFLVSGHHDTPRSIEQAVSPLLVHANAGHAYFLQSPEPTTKTLRIQQDTINITGMSLDPSLGPDQDPLQTSPPPSQTGVNIFLTHYPIEGFQGYFGQETHIATASIPRNYQLFASGHLHHHQKHTINNTPVLYPGSTERCSFQEEDEKKGFLWLELDQTGIVHEEFHQTPARPMETLHYKVSGEASLTRQIQEALERRADTEKIIRVQVEGTVSLEQLSTYKRSTLQTYTEDKFFHAEFNEDQLALTTQTPLEPLPKTTPLQEIDRTFQDILARAPDQDKPLVQEAWKSTLAKLQEEGVT
jgi:DNA repair protein SbcD/Mre11